MENRQRQPGSSPQVKKKRVFTPANPASPHRTGHYAGLHPEDTPHTTAADITRNLQTEQTRHPQFEDDEQEAGFHITSIVRRYNGIPIPDGVMYQRGNDRVYVHNGPPPLPQRAGRGRTTEGHEPVQRTARAPKPRRRVHWLFFVGIGLLIMLAGYMSLNAFTTWWQVHTDDGTYGRPRTYQIDAVVGHGDSRANLSHFIAINLNRHVSIIEFPGGQAAKAVIYSGPVLLGNGQDLTPVTLTFSDVNGDGKVDMLLHILDQSMVYLNNGTRFVPPASIATVGG